MESPIVNGKRRGFTLIELLVVLAIIATLLTLVGPRYLGQTDKAKDIVLRHNLASMRDAIDKYKADKNHYPETLQALSSERYLSKVPEDPITGKSDSWILTAPEGSTGIYNVHSGAEGNGQDGTPYKTW